ncbi:MAG TPA: copper chaperone PCu(A)C [Pseudolabrys sp.]|jgi:copper(I)-binding protein|nr:copper chaperone PCu(A)C [Pseudolabrys sp.]
MNRIALIVIFISAICVGKPAQAEDFVVGSLRISTPWVRATPSGAGVGGGYMTITNTGGSSDRLVGGSSDISARFEIHQMSMDNGVMKMRPVENGVEIKPGQTVEFSPGGFHVMFVGLKKPFEQGQRIAALLQFEKAGRVAVNFTVEPIGAHTGGGSAGGAGMQHGR